MIKARIHSDFTISFSLSISLWINFHLWKNYSLKEIPNEERIYVKQIINIEVNIGGTDFQYPAESVN